LRQGWRARAAWRTQQPDPCSCPYVEVLYIVALCMSIAPALLDWPAKQVDGCGRRRRLPRPIDSRNSADDRCRKWRPVGGAPPAIISGVRDRLPIPQPRCDQLGALPIVAPVQDAHVLGIGAPVNTGRPRVDYRVRV